VKFGKGIVHKHTIKLGMKSLCVYVLKLKMWRWCEIRDSTFRL